MTYVLSFTLPKKTHIDHATALDQLRREALNCVRSCTVTPSVERTVRHAQCHIGGCAIRDAPAFNVFWRLGRGV